MLFRSNEYLPLPPSLNLGTGTSYDYILNWVYTPSSVTNDYVELDCTDDGIVVIIEEICVTKLSTVGVVAKKSDGTILLNSSDVGVYYPDSVYYVDNSSGTATLAKPSILFQLFLEPAEVVGNCLTASFYDSQLTESSMVKNGLFDTDLLWWNYDTYWSWVLSTAAYTPPGSGAYTIQPLTQNITLVGGLIYNLTFDALMASNAIWLSAWTVVGSSTTTTITGFNNSGSFSGQLDLTAYSGNVDITLIFSEAIQNHVNVVLDNIVLKASAPDEFNVSNCFNVVSDAPCTLLFTATNNDNAFDFDYSHGLVHKLRVECKMDVTAYPEEVEVPYIFSNNERVLMFARRDTEYSIFVTDAPDHIHACLSMMRLNDTFTINGAEYIKQSAYELNRRKTSKLKQATFTVFNKQGISSNFP